MINTNLARTFTACALGIAGTAHAIVIDADLISLGGDSYRYEYSLTNDGSLGLGTAIESFSIWFDPALYDEASLSISSSTVIDAAWDEIILSSGIGLPAAYDALANSGGVLVDETLSGFAVEFLWLDSSSLPGVQVFEIFDPNTFALLDSGLTTLASMTPIDEPTVISLVAIGLLVWTGCRSAVRDVSPFRLGVDSGAADVDPA